EAWRLARLGAGSVGRRAAAVKAPVPAPVKNPGPRPDANYYNGRPQEPEMLGFRQRAAALSADGTKVLSSFIREDAEDANHPHESRVVLWSAADGKVIREVATVPHLVLDLALSPDASRAAISVSEEVSFASQLEMRSTEDGKVLWSRGAWYSGLVFAAGGSELHATSVGLIDADIAALDAETGLPLRTRTLERLTPKTEGKRLLPRVVSEEGAWAFTIETHGLGKDSRTGEQSTERLGSVLRRSTLNSRGPYSDLEIASPAGLAFSHLAPSHRGDLLFAIAASNERRFAELYSPLTGARLFRWAEELPDEAVAVDFRGDDRELMVALASGEVWFFTLPESPAVRPLLDRDGVQAPASALAALPDGKSVRAFGEDGIVRTYDVASGRETARVVATPTAFLSLDGGLVVECAPKYKLRVRDAGTGADVALLQFPIDDGGEGGKPRGIDGFDAEWGELVASHWDAGEVGLQAAADRERRFIVVRAVSELVEGAGGASVRVDLGTGARSD
ncbi:MAG TPA: hypothetical protein VHF22_09710, partial [Planctomycetota bacterium]|nr:hypothetical protein [Planctomycetota bacterium]